MTARHLLAVATCVIVAVPVVGPAADDSLVFEGAAAAVAARLAEPSSFGEVKAAAVVAAEPAVLLFSMAGPATARCVRGFADVTGDGVPEVIASFDKSGEPNVFCIDGTSRGTADVVWSFEPTGGATGGAPYGDDALTWASDSDGNGDPNLLIGTAAGGRTGYGVDGAAGAELWRFDSSLEPEPGWVWSLAEMDDVDGDGVADVALGTGSGGEHVYLVSGAAGPGQAPKLWSYAAGDGVVGVRNIGDLNGDGHDDVVAAIGEYGRRLVFLSGYPPAWSPLVLGAYTVSSEIWSLEVMPDVTGDGVKEVLAVLRATDGSAIRCVNGANRQEVWRSTTVLAYGMLASVVGDVSGDGVPDVVASSRENAVSMLSGADGSQVWKTTVGTANGGDVWSARGIGDITGDGIDDVAAGSFDGNVYALDGTDGTILWSYQTGDRVISVAPAGDLNGDGFSEVIAGTERLNNPTVVYVLDGSPGTVFADGFESGDTASWSAAVP